MKTSDTVCTRLAEVHTQGGIVIAIRDNMMVSGWGFGAWQGRVLGVSEPKVGERLRVELDLAVSQPPVWAEHVAGDGRVVEYMSPVVLAFRTRLGFTDGRWVDTAG